MEVDHHRRLVLASPVRRAALGELEAEDQDPVLDAGTPITTPLALASLYRELEKGDRVPTDAQVEPWRDAVEKILRG